VKRQFVALSLLASTMFAALASLTPALANPINEQEFNNHPGQANVLPDFTSTTTLTERWLKGVVFGRGGTVSVTRMDFVDYYRFHVKVDGVRLQLRFASASTLTLAEVHHDADGNGILERERVATARSDNGTLTLDGMGRGHYYVAVGVSGVGGSAYDLIVSVDPRTPSQREVEPNNSPAQATKLTGEFLVGHRMLNGTVNGSPSVLDATDWYTFEVEQKQVAVLLSSAPGLQMELFEDVDRNGVLVSTESRGKATSDDGLPDEIRHRSTASKAKYFLRVLKPTSGSQFYSVGLAGTK
jgi:hypothetical protein